MKTISVKKIAEYCIIGGKSFLAQDFRISYGRIVRDSLQTTEFLIKLEFLPINKIENNDLSLYQGLANDFMNEVSPALARICESEQKVTESSALISKLPTIFKHLENTKIFSLDIMAMLAMKALDIELAVKYP